jgi:hypothetical protein
MFSVTAAGACHGPLSAADASTKARELRRDGANDVEIHREDGTRISQYALDQLVRAAKARH